MKGKVLVFDAAAGTGIVNGEDGKRYAFTAADNKSPTRRRPMTKWTSSPMAPTPRTSSS